MSKSITYLLLGYMLFYAFPCSAQPSTASETLQRFYQAYLNYDYRKTPNVPTPALPFSKSFQAEIDKNAHLCEEYSDEICGWGADNDVYLDTQDHDDDLNFDKAKVRLKEVSKGVIRVTFSVFPSEPDPRGYDKIVTYKMKQENGAWVVDDIVYNDKRSSRAMINQENADLLRDAGKHTDSD